MDSTELATFLRKIKAPLVSELSTPQLKTVISAAKERRYPSRAVVCSQGTIAKQVFLLIKGRARFFFLTPQGEKILLMWVPEGEAFGSAALRADPYEHIVSTETLRDSIMLVWDKRTFRRLAARYPRLMENFFSEALEYLTFYVATHSALVSSSASQRVASVLFNLARGIGRVVPEGLELDASNEELAQAANVTHFTVSRLLNKWHREGIVKKVRGKILLRSPLRLLASKYDSRSMLNPADRVLRLIG